MTIGHNSSMQVFKMKSFRFSLALFLMLVLISAQTIVLQHDHVGDLSQHADCSICIKQGAESDALPVIASVFNALGRAALFAAEPDSALSATPLVNRSRGPPPLSS